MGGANIQAVADMKAQYGDMVVGFPIFSRSDLPSMGKNAWMRDCFTNAKPF